MLAFLEAGRTGQPVSPDWGCCRTVDPAVAVPDSLGVTESVLILPLS